MPESAQLNILIETGADFILPHRIKDENGEPMDLTGATVVGQLREFAEAADSFEFACMHNGTGGRILVTMPHETTSKITYASGVYDVLVTLADGVTSYPLHGDVTIRHGVTKSYDGAVLFMLGISSYDDLPDVGNPDRLYFCYDDRKIYRWNGNNYIATAVGNGIQKIEYLEKVSTFVDKYRITFDDGTYFDYLVTNAGVTSVSKVSSSGTPRTGIVDTYRMTFTSGNTADFTVTNGRAFDVKATYDSTQTYEYLDMVRSGGATYVALQDVPANTSISNTDYWIKILAPFAIGTVDTGTAGSDAVVTITGTADAPVLNFIIPRGTPGNESIDDTAGSGDTDRVWSANKSYDELTNIKSQVNIMQEKGCQITTDYTLEYGTITDAGVEEASTTHKRSDYILMSKAVYLLKARTGYTVDVHYYKYDTSTETYIWQRKSNVGSSAIDFSPYNWYYAVRLVFKGATEADINGTLLFGKNYNRTNIEKIENYFVGKYRPFLYVSSNKYFYTQKNGGIYELVVPSSANIVLTGNGNTSFFTISADDILTIASNYSTICTVSNRIISSEDLAIYYDVADNEVKFSKLTSLKFTQNTIILFACRYGSGCSGLLLDAEIYKKYDDTVSVVNSNTQRIIALENQFPNVPDYFLDQVNSKIENIKTNMQEVGINGETFAFITDIHWSRNVKKSPGILYKIRNETGFKYVINGGDNITYGEKDDMMADAYAVMNAFNWAGNSFKNLFGNHDSNKATQEELTERWFTNEEVYAIQQKRQEPVDYGSYFYFSFDNPTTKTRFVCLSTGVGLYISQTQFSWLESILQTNDNYKVIVFAHALYNSGTPTESTANLYTLCDNYAAKVMAIFGGHSHVDYNTTTTGGIPVILTDTDSLDTLGSTPAVRDTVTELAFDIVTVNYSNGNIKCTRIGRGDNRTIVRE